jgi:hypothetical protein
MINALSDPSNDTSISKGPVVITQPRGCVYSRRPKHALQRISYHTIMWWYISVTIYRFWRSILYIIIHLKILTLTIFMFMRARQADAMFLSTYRYRNVFFLWRMERRTSGTFFDRHAIFVDIWVYHILFSNQKNANIIFNPYYWPCLFSNRWRYVFT